MAIRAKGGTPNYHDGAIKRVYSMLAIENFFEQSVLGVMANYKYQGEIKGQGDTVVIYHDPVLATRDLVPGEDLVIDEPEIETSQLTIDYGDYFNTRLQDIFKHQMAMDFMSRWVKAGQESMKLRPERRVLNVAHTKPAAMNRGTNAGRKTQSINLGTIAAPVALTKDNVGLYFSRHNLVLTEALTLTSGQPYAIVPPVVGHLIRQAPGYAEVQKSGDDTSIARSGLIGTIMGFPIYETTLSHFSGVGAAQKYAILTGTNYALSFAMDLKMGEALRSELQFANLERAQQFYGFEWLKPEACAAGHITIAADQR